MKDSDTTSGDLKKKGRLRTRAESCLADQSRPIPDVSGMSEKHLQQIIHELQVHQIELEIQNEELQRALLERELSEARYRDLYDFAPVGYLSVDNHGAILDANLTATILLGRDRSNLIGRPLQRFIFSQDSDTFQLMLDKMFASNDRQSCELKFHGKDLSLFEAQLDGSVSEEEESIHVTQG